MPARAESDPASTRTERLFERIRLDILNGRFPPSSKLPFAEMVQTYGGSIGSLREALQRLVELGLVISKPQLGFTVAEVSAADLQDLIEARLEIEVAAFRRSIQDGTMEWEASAVAAHHVLDRTPPSSPEAPDRFTEEWSSAHRAFHQALLAGCGNRRLLAAAADLRDAAELYRRWSIPMGPDRTRDSRGEHRALLDAAIDRDVDLAAELLRSHILHTRYDLLPDVDSSQVTEDG